jgi:hypothetical protein
MPDARHTLTLARHVVVRGSEMDWKMPGLVAAIGLLLIVYEWNIAAKKKQGVTAVDRKRMMGMLGFTAFLSGLAWFIGTVA